MLVSAKVMEKYVQEGRLNPRVEPTQSGFSRLFATWLIEQDLSFTTGMYCLRVVVDLMLTTSNRGIWVYQSALQIHSVSIFPSI